MYERAEKPKQKNRVIEKVSAPGKEESKPVSQIADNRFPNKAAAQLKTTINYTTGTVDYYTSPNANNNIGTQTVGKKVEATLDPEKPLKGSATGDPQKSFNQAIRAYFANESMVRGHLLNHDLGGYGVEDNLFPITNAANSMHKTKVEYGVKGALQNANSTTGDGVFYSVEVIGDTNFAQDEPKSAFVCHAHELSDLDTSDTGTKGNDILDVTVNSTPKHSGPKRASAMRTSAVDKNTQSEPKGFKYTAGLNDWKHGSRKGKEDWDKRVNKGKMTGTEVSSSMDLDENVIADAFGEFIDNYEYDYDEPFLIDDGGKYDEVDASIAFDTAYRKKNGMPSFKEFENEY
ncbi:MAG TPA: hypothetical protein PLB87_10480 [Prolixibacteraceae bacterium]|nr:hypothetical protein [Prolixibacteraceae bacterium]